MGVTYATACSGIGCAETAAASIADWEHVFTSEIDPFACAVLKRRHGDAPNLGDMTVLADRIRLFGDCAADVLIAGTPCQAFSIAGLRGSLNDARGNLTLELVRTLDAIDDQRLYAGIADRCTLIWENVPGVLSTKDNAFGCFLAALVGADEPIPPFGRKGKWPRSGLVHGPRRRACWRILDARWFGVAQRRKRLFVVAGAGDGFDPSAVLLEPEGVSRNPPASGTSRQRTAAPLAACTRRSSGYRNDADTTENLIPEIIGTLEAGQNKTGGDRPPGTSVDTSDCLIPVAYGDNNTSGPIDVATARSAHGGPHGKLDFETETFLVTGEDVTHALNTANNGKHCSEDGTGRGVPIIAFDSRQDTVSSEESFGSLGASSPQSQAIAFQTSQSGTRLDTIHSTLDSNNGSRRHNGVLSNYRVRRLTPLECERLQGIPDGYTDVLYRGKPAADGPRYRAIGNGMAVPCVAWILKRLDLHLKGII